SRASWAAAGRSPPRPGRPREPWRARPRYSWSRSWTAKVRRSRTRQAATAPSSMIAVMPFTSARRMPSIVAAARATASPTASSIELVDVPVSSIVFSTMVRASRRPSFGHARGDCNRAEGLAARATGRDAPPRAGRFPLVLVAHGNCGFRTNYEYLTVPLAAEGFVVAAPDFPGFNKAVCDAGAGSIGDIAHDPEGDLAFLRAVLHERTGPAARFARHVRGRRAGLVGHSLGGYVVLRAVLADPAFSVVAALAPLAVFGREDFAHLSPRRTFLLAGATGDRTLPYATVTAPLFALLPPRAYLLEIVGGSHSGFTDMDSTLAPAALAREQALVRRYVTALFSRWLAHRRRAART